MWKTPRLNLEISFFQNCNQNKQTGMLIILMLHGSVDPPFSCFNKKFSIKIGHTGDSNSHKTHEAYCASANFIHCAIPKCSAALIEPVKQHDINWTLVELCKSLHVFTMWQIRQLLRLKMGGLHWFIKPHFWCLTLSAVTTLTTGTSRPQAVQAYKGLSSSPCILKCAVCKWWTHKKKKKISH